MHRYGFNPGYGPGFGVDRAGMFIMMAGILLVLAVVAALILFLVLRKGHFKHYHNFANVVNTNRALEILNERLASGEITEEEYTEKTIDNK